jgi:hypothetical protein
MFRGNPIVSRGWTGYLSREDPTERRSLAHAATAEIMMECGDRVRPGLRRGGGQGWIAELPRALGRDLRPQNATRKGVPSSDATIHHDSLQHAPPRVSGRSFVQSIADGCEALGRGGVPRAPGVSQGPPQNRPGRVLQKWRTLNPAGSVSCINPEVRRPPTVRNRTGRRRSQAPSRSGTGHGAPRDRSFAPVADTARGLPAGAGPTAAAIDGDRYAPCRNSSR